MLRASDSRDQKEMADACSASAISSSGRSLPQGSLFSALGPFQKGPSKQTPFRAIGAAFVACTVLISRESRQPLLYGQTKPHRSLRSDV